MRHDLDDYAMQVLVKLGRTLRGLHMLDHVFEEDVHLAFLRAFHRCECTSNLNLRSALLTHREVHQQVLNEDLGDLGVLQRVLDLGHDLHAPELAIPAQARAARAPSTRH